MRRDAISTPRFIVVHIIGGTRICYAMSVVAEAIVAVLIVHSTSNIAELFVQALVVLQTIQFLHSGFVTWLYNPRITCLSSPLLVMGARLESAQRSA